MSHIKRLEYLTANALPIQVDRPALNKQSGGDIKILARLMSFHRCIGKYSSKAQIKHRSLSFLATSIASSQESYYRRILLNTKNFVGLQKLVRFATIYGLRRALFKALGRIRRFRVPFFFRRGPREVGVIGCGQYAYATIGYFLLKNKRQIKSCFDTDKSVQRSFERSFAITKETVTATNLFDSNPAVIYIASNHASHAKYAIEALALKIPTYVEKPIAVSIEQLVALESARRKTGAKLFAGFNRPFSGALRLLRENIRQPSSAPITLQCFISGHVISEEHWYRLPDEGTRICGNLGHWIDLMIHLMSLRSLPQRLQITAAYANSDEPDDNLALSFTTELNDLVSIVMTSRSEPFDGIHETINFQHESTIAKIDDFRRIEIWSGSKKITRNFYPKDVGHESAILQPYSNAFVRDWEEVLMSTLICLFVADMVRNKREISVLDLSRARLDFEHQISSELDK
jgi:predicted dehydrogenase